MARVRYDLHTHTTFSDGYDWQEMAAAADRAGLSGIGFTDHCPVVPDEFGRRDRYGFAETYERRREEFADAALDIDVFDGAEINWVSPAAAEIADFLASADFEYTIGSVHFTASYYTAHPSEDLQKADDEVKRAAIEEYVDWQIDLVESELVDVLGHLDVTQRAGAYGELFERADYERLARALATSRTVPEINAGRLDRDGSILHPRREALEVFAEHGVPFVIGTDAHAPDQLERRIALLEEELDDLDVEILDLPPALAGRVDQSH